jgi:hypothetical protein
VVILEHQEQVDIQAMVVQEFQDILAIAVQLVHKAHQAILVFQV